MKIEITKEAAAELKRLLFISAISESNKMSSTGLSNVMYFINAIEAAEAAEETTEVEDSQN